MAPTNDWIASFLRDGFVHLPRVVDERTITAARRRIDNDLAENYDPFLKPQYDARSFCPAILGSSEIMELFKNRGVQQHIDQLVARKKVGFDEGQVAIRQAHNADQNYPPSAHIDGIPTPHNGVPGNELAPFTLLIGVFLSEVKKEFAGNFTVWPGSHLLLEKYFNQRGSVARTEGMPRIDLGEPVQLLCSPGDVVICHYQLAHGAAVNTSDNDRYAVFFRMWHHELDRHKCTEFRENGWIHLTKIWTGWKVASVS